MKWIGLILLTTATNASAIIGGIKSETCQHSQAVALTNFAETCSGVLIHERVIAYAAHCGSDFSNATFGESVYNPEASIAIERCAAFRPEDTGVGEHDIAICILSEDAPVAPTPIATGCELKQHATVGSAVTIVGFGETATGSLGDKYWADVAIGDVNSSGTVLSVGGAGKTASHGDSGGPAFVKTLGGIRVLGIASGGAIDGGPTLYPVLSQAIGWMERESGLDVSPCHTPHGEWDPSESCSSFSRTTVSAVGWDNQCLASDIALVSTTCGPHPNDIDAPTLDFTIDTISGNLHVTAEATDPSDRIASLEIELDGQLQTVITGSPPYSHWIHNVAASTPTVTLRATDGSGNSTEASQKVNIPDQNQAPLGCSNGSPGRLLIVGILLMMFYFYSREN